jgi:hypothetical protein
LIILLSQGYKVLFTTNHCAMCGIFSIGPVSKHIFTAWRMIFLSIKVKCNSFSYTL